jgi:peroxiredoxin family protein
VDGGEKKTIIVFSGELDKAMAAFTIATGALAMGRRGDHVLHLLGAQRPP